MVFSYFGPSGTFTEEAAKLFVKKHKIIETNLTPLKSQQEVIKSVHQDESIFGVVPIESSVSGSVSPTLDGIVAYPKIQIIDELELPISFTMVSFKEMKLSEIKSLSVYPISNQQIQNWLENNLPDIEIITAQSNSQAVELLSTNQADAAITTPVVANSNPKFHILAKNVADDANAKTRFLLIKSNNNTYSVQSADCWITGLVFDLPNLPGTLAKALDTLAKYNVDLRRIESRPKRDQTNKYWFFIEFYGNSQDSRVHKAINELKEQTIICNFFGSWPKAQTTN